MLNIPGFVSPLRLYPQASSNISWNNNSINNPPAALSRSLSKSQAIRQSSQPNPKTSTGSISIHHRQPVLAPPVGLQTSDKIPTTTGAASQRLRRYSPTPTIFCILPFYVILVNILAKIDVSLHYDKACVNYRCYSCSSNENSSKDS